jgi:transcriptional regulator with XRE-family HTH domain
MTDFNATARLVAGNVRRLRDARGLSLRRFSEELKKHGCNLSADAVNKIENGRELELSAPLPKQVRRVDVDELVALAATFGVTTDELLLPPGQARRGDGHRSVDLTEELLDAVRDVVDPGSDTDVARRTQTARRLMAQLALELDEITDNGEADGRTER